MQEGKQEASLWGNIYDMKLTVLDDHYVFHYTAGYGDNSHGVGIVRFDKEGAFMDVGGANIKI